MRAPPAASAGSEAAPSACCRCLNLATNLCVLPCTVLPPCTALQLGRLPTLYNADTGLFIMNSNRWTLPPAEIRRASGQTALPDVVAASCASVTADPRSLRTLLLVSNRQISAGCPPPASFLQGASLHSGWVQALGLVGGVDHGRHLSAVAGALYCSACALYCYCSALHCAGWVLVGASAHWPCCSLAYCLSACAPCLSIEVCLEPTA